MGYTLTINVPDEVYHSLRTIGSERGRSPEQLAREWLEDVSRTLDDDPVLRLSGIVTTDIDDVAVNHDLYIGRALANPTKGDADA